MKLLAFVLSLVFIVGCGSVYERAADDIQSIESEGSWVMSVEWEFTDRNEYFKYDGDSVRNKAKSDLRGCVRHLEDRKSPNGRLVVPAPKNKAMATIQIVECMAERGWRPKYNGVLITT